MKIWLFAHNQRLEETYFNCPACWDEIKITENGLFSDWLLSFSRSCQKIYTNWFLEACSLAKSGQIFHKMSRVYLSCTKTLSSLISSYWFRAGKWLQCFKAFVLRSFCVRKMFQPFTDFFLKGGGEGRVRKRLPEADNWHGKFQTE